MKKIILLRAEDRDFKGQGHRSRIEAICQACEKKGLSAYLLTTNNFWETKLKNKHFNKIIHIKNTTGEKSEAKEILKKTKLIKPSHLFLDGDRFKNSLVKHFVKSKVKIVKIDDNYKAKKGKLWAVINPNIYAKKYFYSEGTFKKVLVGKKYILLRREFQKKIFKRKNKNRILISLGVSAKKSLIQLLKKYLKKFGWQVSIARNLNTKDMVKAIDRASLVICGASVTLHEVWSRKTAAIPIYQARDQVRFQKWCKEKSIPVASSINKPFHQTAQSVARIFRNLNTKPLTIPKIKTNGADEVIKKLFS